MLLLALKGAYKGVGRKEKNEPQNYVSMHFKSFYGVIII